MVSLRLIQHASAEARQILILVYNAILKFEYIPAPFLSSTIFPTPKSEPQFDTSVDTVRPITLLATGNPLRGPAGTMTFFLKLLEFIVNYCTNLNKFRAPCHCTGWPPEEVARCDCGLGMANVFKTRFWWCETFSR